MKDITSSVYNFEDLIQGNFLYVDKTVPLLAEQFIKVKLPLYFHKHLLLLEIFASFADFLY